MKQDGMTIEKIQLYEKLMGQLEGLHKEIALMAKRAPNEAINPFKLKFVNTIIDQWNGLLEGTYRPFADFKQFSSDDLPTNSDVTFMLAQYMEAAEAMRVGNIESNLGRWHWRKHTDRETYPPRKLTSK
jgi:hypothetical protein